jgi:hypothetical protein
MITTTNAIKTSSSIFLSLIFFFFFSLLSNISKQIVFVF